MKNSTANQVVEYLCQKRIEKGLGGNEKIRFLCIRFPGGEQRSEGDETK
jgi:hypothetical protein